MNSKSSSFPFTLNLKGQYSYISGVEEGASLILLHGFAQNGQNILDKFLDDKIHTVSVFAPNGPFLLPSKKPSEEKRYSWYFFDRTKNLYLTDLRATVDMVCQFIKHIGYDQREFKLIGFSQGGYLLPYIAQRYPQVSQVIGIGSRYRSEDLSGPFDFRLDAIHGKEDQIVETKRSQRCHQELIQQGAKGEFRVIPGLGHDWNGAVTEQLKSLLSLV